MCVTGYALLGRNRRSRVQFDFEPITRVRWGRKRGFVFHVGIVEAF